MPGVFGYEVHTGNQCRGCLYWKLSLLSKELKRKTEKKMICLLRWVWVRCGLVQFWALKPNRNFLHLCRQVLQPEAETLPHHSSVITRFTQIILWVNVYTGLELRGKNPSIIRNNLTSGIGKEKKVKGTQWSGVKDGVKILQNHLMYTIQNWTQMTEAKNRNYS